MKKEVCIIACIALLFSFGLAYAAPPSFHIISGYVFCSDDLNTPLVSYTINNTVENGTDSFEESGSVSESGLYFFIIDADSTYINHFYVDGVEVGNISYVVFGVTTDLNFTTDSLTYCGDPIIPPPGTGGPSGRTTTGGSTPTVTNNGTNATAPIQNGTYDQNQSSEQENMDGGVETFPVNPSGDVAFWSTIGLFVVILGIMGFLFYRLYKKSSHSNKKV